MINIWELAEPYSWRKKSKKNLRPYLNLYQQDEEGYLEFIDRFESSLVSAPVEIFIRFWHTPVRGILSGFLSGEPRHVKIFWKL